MHQIDLCSMVDFFQRNKILQYFLNLLDGRLPAKQFGAPFLDFLNQRVEGLLCFGELRLLWWQGNQQADGVALGHCDVLEN